MIYMIWSAAAYAVTVKPSFLQPLAEAAIEVHPVIKATRQQREVPQHQVPQNYAPADPIFSCGNVDSSRHFNAADPSHLFGARLALREAELQALDTATPERQAIPEATPAEKNSTLALKLAEMKCLPDYSVDSLQVAPGNTNSVLSRAEANATQLYRSAQFAEESAEQYKRALIRGADEEIRMALVAYQTGKVGFFTLSAAFKSAYAAGITSLKRANQFLAGEVALEQVARVQFPR